LRYKTQRLNLPLVHNWGAGHHEELTLESLEGKEEDGKVVFFAYTGVAPRIYQQLFSMSERGAKKGNSISKWFAKQASLAPLYVSQNASLLYLAAESEELKELPSSIYSSSCGTTSAANTTPAQQCAAHKA
jgi:hypothetical protein